MANFSTQFIRHLAVVVLLLTGSYLSVTAQTTYRWNNTGGGAWNVTTNWTPISGAGTTFPANGDAIVLDQAGTYTINTVSTTTLTSISVSGTANVTLTGTAATLTVSGGTAAANNFNIANGSGLTIGSGVTVAFGAPVSQTGTIAGSLTVATSGVFNTTGLIAAGTGTGISVSGTITNTGGTVTSGIVFNGTSTAANTTGSSSTLAFVLTPTIVAGAMISGPNLANSSTPVTVVSLASNNVTMSANATVTSTSSSPYQMTSLRFTSTGTYRHQVAGAGATLPFASWDPASTFIYNGTNNTGTYSNFGQSFGNVTWTANGGTGTGAVSLALTTVTIYGTLNVNGTGSTGSLALITTSTSPSTINNINVSIVSPSAVSTLIVKNGSGTTNFNTASTTGSISVSTGILRLVASTGSINYFTNTVAVSGGQLDLGASGTSNLNVVGTANPTVNITTPGIITRTGSTGTIVFAGTGTQYYTGYSTAIGSSTSVAVNTVSTLSLNTSSPLTLASLSNLTVQGTLNTNANTVTVYNMPVNSGGVVNLNTGGAISVVSGGTLTIGNGTGTGTLNVNDRTVTNASTSYTFLVGSGGNVNLTSGSINTGTGAMTNQNNGTVDFGASGTVTGGTFTASSGSTTRTANSAGFVATGGGASGSVLSTTRNYSTGSSYVFNSGAANTGSGITGSFTNITINNPTGVTLITGPVTVTGTLTLTNGYFDIGANALTLSAAPAGNGGAAVTNFNNTNNNYIITGTGTVTGSNINATPRLFPVGANSSSYTPLTITGTASATAFTVGASKTFANAPTDASLMVNNQWSIVAASGVSPVTYVFQWTSPSDEGGAFDHNATGANALVARTLGTGAGNYGTISATYAAGAGSAYTATITGQTAQTVANQANYVVTNSGGATGTVFPPTITSFTSNNPATTQTGYVGSTITINGTNLGSVTSVTIGGVGATNITYISNSQITVTAAAGTVSGNIIVTNSAGSYNSSSIPSSFTFLGYITNAATDWNTGSTWLGGTVPPAGATVIVAHAITVNGTVANSPASVTNNSTITFGASGNLTVAGTLTNAGTIAFGGAGTLTISAGTLTNNGTINVSNGTIAFSGATGILNGTNGATMNNVSVNTALAISTAPTINGTLTLGSLAPTGSITGSAPNYGPSSTLVYSQSGSKTRGVEWSATSGAGYPNNVTVQNGTTLDIGAGAPATAIAVANTLNIAVTSTVTANAGGNQMTAPLTVKNIVFNSGGTLTMSALAGNNLVITGNWTVSTGTFNANGGTVIFNGGAAQSIDFGSVIGTLTLANVSVTNNTPVTATNTSASSSLNINGNFNIAAGSSFIYSGITETFTLGASSVTTVFGTLTNSNSNNNITQTAGGTITVKNGGRYSHWRGAASVIITATWEDGSTMEIGGAQTSGNQSPTATSWSQSFYDVKWNPAIQSGIINLEGKMSGATIRHDFIVANTSATTNGASPALCLTDGSSLNLTIGNDLLVNGTSSLQIAGNIAGITPNATCAVSVGRHVSITGNGGLIGAGPQANSGGGTPTLNITGNLTVNSTFAPFALGVVTGTGPATLNVTGDVTFTAGIVNLNGFSPAGTGTAQLNQTGATNTFLVNGGTLNVIGSTAAPAVRPLITVAGNFSVTSGTIDFTPAGGGSNNPVAELRVAKDFSFSGGDIKTTGSSNHAQLTFNGTTQAFSKTSAGTFSGVNVVINNGSTTTLNTDLGFTGSLQSTTVNTGGQLNTATYIVNGSVFTLSAGGTLGIGSPAGITPVGTAAGNVQSTTTRSYNSGGNYLYNGASAQVTGTGLPATVNNLNVSNANGVELTNDVTANGTLILNTGILDANTNNKTVTVSATGTVSRTSGHVYGNLKKAVNAGNSTVVFEIGNSANYTPASVSFTSAGAGDFVARVTEGNHPNIATVCVNPLKNVNQYWTFTNAGVTSLNYGATFTYTAGDIIGSAAQPFVANQYYSSAWTSANVVSSAGLSTQVSGLTTDGDFQLGEACSPTWVGNISIDWFDKDNWNPAIVPGGCGVSVTIPSSTTFSPTISTASVNIGNISIDDNATLTLQGQNITVCNSWTGGNSSNAVIAGTGTVIFGGSIAQTISGRTRFETLQINNSHPSGVSLATGAIADVYTALNLQAGSLNATNGTITLKSTAVNSVALLDNFSSGYAGTYIGNITAERYYNPSVTFKQHMMGSPVNTPSLSQFGASGTPGFIKNSTCDETKSDANTPYGTVFSFDETNGTTCGMEEWKSEISGSAQNGRGYSVLRNGAGTLQLTGTPNLASSYSVSGLTNSNWSHVTLQNRPLISGWSLVSNPYSATLNISPASISANQAAGFDAQILVWNANGGSAGSYTATTVIAPFQAFLVHKTATGGTATYTLYGNDRVTSNALFYREEKQTELDITATNITSGLIDQIKIAYNPNATSKFDPSYDVYKIPGALNRHTLYTLNNNQWLMHNVLRSINETNTIPVGFEPGVSGTYTLSFDGINSFDPTSYLMLEDKLLNVWHNVRNGNYTFTANETDNWNRFVLHFTPAAQLLTTDAGCTTPGMINIEQPGTANWNYTLANANTAAIASGVLNAGNPVNISLPAGTYVLALVDNQGYTVTRSIEVAGSQPVIAAFTSSTSTAQIQDNINFASTTEQATTYTWDFGDGSTAYGKLSNHIYINEGVYNATLTVENASGCSSTTSQTITITSRSVTGINEATSKKLNIWGTDGRIYVDFSRSGSTQAVVTICNILGQQLAQDKFSVTGLYSKAVNGIQNGYVIVNVKMGDDVVTKKIFISNIK